MDARTSVSSAAPFAVAKIQKQGRCPPIERIQKMFIHMMEFYWATKIEILPSAGNGSNWR